VTQPRDERDRLAVLRVYFSREFLRFLGPGFIVTVGFVDPGNWATTVGLAGVCRAAAARGGQLRQPRQDVPVGGHHVVEG
jgi:hypothetical protein